MEAKPNTARRGSLSAFIVGLVILSCSAVPLWAAANGSVSGTLLDPSGAVVPNATIMLVNTALKSEFKTNSNGQGFYSFPTLPVGRYDMAVEAAGFKTEKKANLAVDTDSALKLDIVLELGQESETVVVQSVEAQVDTVATHLGEVVIGSQMTALPLNGAAVCCTSAPAHLRVRLPLAASCGYAPAIVRALMAITVRIALRNLGCGSLTKVQRFWFENKCPSM